MNGTIVSDCPIHRLTVSYSQLNSMSIIGITVKVKGRGQGGLISNNLGIRRGGQPFFRRAQVVPEVVSLGERKPVIGDDPFGRVDLNDPIIELIADQLPG